MKNKVFLWTLILIIGLSINGYALTQSDVPAIYSNIIVKNGKPFVKKGSKLLSLVPHQDIPDYSLSQLRGNPVGTKKGFLLDFSDLKVSRSPEKGKLFYSLINMEDSRFPVPHYRFLAHINKSAKAEIIMKKLKGKFDLSNSEDDSIFDPNPKIPGDYPAYSENVYHYSWDNVAMIVLNSQYTPSLPYPSEVGGNVWGYIMENQLKWLKKTLDKYESDPAIDHVFVTQHTPVFPNGGHVKGFKSMWFNGENIKPKINGIDMDIIPGGIEMRDRFLKLLLDHSKVKAILVGDEHNYSKLLIKHGMPLYDKNKYVPKVPLAINRNLWHLCAGSAGAPYYSYEEAVWNKGYPEDKTYLKKITPQHAVAFFHINGKKLTLEVINPLTLEKIE